MSEIQKYQNKDEDLNYFKTLTEIAQKSGGITKDMSREMMLNIMLTAKDFGISPMKALNGGFYVVKGKISMSTALMVDRIRAAGHSIKITEWTAQKCVIIGIRKDNGDSVKFEYTMEDANQAQLTGGDSWKKYPKHMLYNRCMSTIARSLFSDVVGNCYSEDERWEMSGEKDPMYEGSIPVVVACEDRETIVIRPPINMEGLKQMISQEDLDLSQLEAHVNELANKHQASVEKIVESAMNPQLFEKFKVSYAKRLEASKAVDVPGGF